MSSDVSREEDVIGETMVRSEDELGIKWDRCVADTIIKTGLMWGSGGGGGGGGVSGGV